MVLVEHLLNFPGTPRPPRPYVLTGGRRPRHAVSSGAANNDILARSHARRRATAEPRRRLNRGSTTETNFGEQSVRLRGWGSHVIEFFALGTAPPCEAGHAGR